MFFLACNSDAPGPTVLPWRALVNRRKLAREHYYRSSRFYIALRDAAGPMQCFSIPEMAIVYGSQKSFHTFTLSQEDMRYNIRDNESKMYGRRRRRRSGITMTSTYA